MFFIRRALLEEIDSCDQIARDQEKRAPGSLGWVMKLNLIKSLEQQQLLVAIDDDQVIGFVLYTLPTRGVNQGWNVIHTLAVAHDHQGKSVGRNLLYAVPTPTRLSCPNRLRDDRANPALQFYAHSGMALRGERLTQSTRKPLSIFEREILPIYVFGSNKSAPQVARETGWAYGVRHTEYVYDYPLHMDINWRDYDWQDFMHKIYKYRPVSALAADYEHPDQRPKMLKQLADLRAAGVQRIMCCPKFAGAIRDFPHDVILAISIPSGYAGFVPPLEEMTSHRVHLLGGTPVSWFGEHGRKVQRNRLGYIGKFLGVGAIIVSVDGNSHQRMALKKKYWLDGITHEHADKDSLHDLTVISGKAINQQLLQSHGTAQPRLL